MGMPVVTASWPPARWARLRSKATAMCGVSRAANWLARPGTALDSWIRLGSPAILAPTMTGALG